MKQPDDDFTLNAKCVAAATVCGRSSISQSGKCTPCSYGMVADASRCKCIVCGKNEDSKITPLLSVKSPNTNFSPDAVCVAANSTQGGCGSNEVVNDVGHCSPCPAGQVADSLRAKCVVCGQGQASSLNSPNTVKFPNNGYVNEARCVRANDAKEGCGTSEIANSMTGQCGACSYGEIADAGRLRCVICGKGTSSSVNPPGTVKYPNTNFDVNALCVRAAAAGGCGSNQIADANTGQCTPCARGMVADLTRTACITCGLGSPSSLNPPSTVKSPDNGFSVNASCVRGAEVGCGSNQIAIKGLCTACGYGQVADVTHATCVTCGQGAPSSVNPPASVKYPNDMVSANASCVSARSTRGCGTNQYADRTSGLCAYCSDGQVTNADGSGCSYCGAVNANQPPSAKGNAKGKSLGKGVGVECTVKNTNAYVVNAQCVPAARACGSNQIAERGKCISCAAGLIPDVSRCACVPCPFCTVKIPNNGFSVNASCVAAGVVCGSSAYADVRTARCTPCPVNQVANTKRCQCIACGTNTAPLINPTCSYKVPNDNLDMNALCKPASSCGTSAISLNGKCEFCSFGQVANTDNCRCITCGQNTEPKINPRLSVKFPDSDHSSSSTCVAAREGCGSSEIANEKGTCTPCPLGKVANEAHSACVFCGRGGSTSQVNPPLTVKYPNNDHASNAKCIAASAKNGCGTNQIVNEEGHCKQCSYGQVANAVRSACVICGQGSVSSTNPPFSVKIPNNEYILSARCVPATEGCGSNQYANNITGQCEPCTFGTVADEARRACLKCGQGKSGSLNPPRTIKYPNNGFSMDAKCVSPVDACGTNEIANFAQAACLPCPIEEVASSNRLYCEDCYPLTKCPNDSESVNATCCYPTIDLPG